MFFTTVFYLKMATLLYSMVPGYCTVNNVCAPEFLSTDATKKDTQAYSLTNEAIAMSGTRVFHCERTTYDAEVRPRFQTPLLLARLLLGSTGCKQFFFVLGKVPLERAGHIRRGSCNSPQLGLASHLVLAYCVVA